MQLFDIDHGHYVGHVEDDRLVSRWGWSFAIEGYAVVENDDVVGTFIDGEFYNRYGRHMATTKRPN